MGDIKIIAEKPAMTDKSMVYATYSIRTSAFGNSTTKVLTTNVDGQYESNITETKYKYNNPISVFYRFDNNTTRRVIVPLSKLYVKGFFLSRLNKKFIVEPPTINIIRDGEDTLIRSRLVAHGGNVGTYGVSVRLIDGHGIKHRSNSFDYVIPRENVPRVYMIECIPFTIRGDSGIEAQDILINGSTDSDTPNTLGMGKNGPGAVTGLGTQDGASNSITTIDNWIRAYIPDSVTFLFSNTLQYVSYALFIDGNRRYSNSATYDDNTGLFTVDTSDLPKESTDVFIDITVRYLGTVFTVRRQIFVENRCPDKVSGIGTYTTTIPTLPHVCVMAMVKTKLYYRKDNILYSYDIKTQIHTNEQPLVTGAYDSSITINGKWMATISGMGINPINDQYYSNSTILVYMYDYVNTTWNYAYSRSVTSWVDSNVVMFSNGNFVWLDNDKSGIHITVKSNAGKTVIINDEAIRGIVNSTSPTLSHDCDDNIYVVTTNAVYRINNVNNDLDNSYVKLFDLEQRTDYDNFVITWNKFHEDFDDTILFGDQTWMTKVERRVQMTRPDERGFYLFDMYDDKTIVYHYLFSTGTYTNFYYTGKYYSTGSNGSNFIIRKMDSNNLYVKEVL